MIIAKISVELATQRLPQNFAASELLHIDLLACAINGSAILRAPNGSSADPQEAATA